MSGIVSEVLVPSPQPPHRRSQHQYQYNRATSSNESTTATTQEETAQAHPATIQPDWNVLTNQFRDNDYIPNVCSSLDRPTLEHILQLLIAKDQVVIIIRQSAGMNSHEMCKVIRQSWR
jgi:hypothetical protein